MNRSELIAALKAAGAATGQARSLAGMIMSPTGFFGSDAYRSGFFECRTGAQCQTCGIQHSTYYVRGTDFVVAQI